MNPARTNSSDESSGKLEPRINRMRWVMGKASAMIWKGLGMPSKEFHAKYDRYGVCSTGYCRKLD